MIKKIMQRAIYPSLSVLFLFITVSVSLLQYVFWGAVVDLWIVLAAVLSSAYTLFALGLRIPRIVYFLKRVKNENRVVRRFFADAEFRMTVFLYGSIFMNALYAAFQLGLGLYHKSAWFYSLAAYYGLLVFMRSALLRDIRILTPGENLMAELHRYRFCGSLLLIMNLALMTIVSFISYFGRGVEHHPVTTVILAAYSFTSLSFAVINAVRYRKYYSPIFSATKGVSLAAAVVSMLTLETALLSAFGDERVLSLRGPITLFTGIVVCMTVLLIAVYMIVHSTRALNALRRATEID